MAEKKEVHRCHAQYNPLSLLKIKRNPNYKTKRKKKNPKNLTLALGSSLDALYVALQGLFIGAEGIRVPVELPYEIWYRDKIKLPRKRGFCRDSAAILWHMATRFGAWLLLVRPSSRLLLEVLILALYVGISR